MSLDTIRGARTPVHSVSTILEQGLNAPMTRKEFLKMSGALCLSLLGIQSLFQTFTAFTHTTAPKSLLSESGDGFGTRKFGG